LLNKMMEDDLLFVRNDIINGRLRKIYSINPQIIRSPIKGRASSNNDSVNSEIPIDKEIERFLEWNDEDEISAFWNRTEIFKTLKKTTHKIDYCAFIESLLFRASLKKNDRMLNFLFDYINRMNESREGGKHHMNFLSLFVGRFISKGISSTFLSKNSIPI
jgi:hypothetical protein